MRSLVHPQRPRRAHDLRDSPRMCEHATTIGQCSHSVAPGMLHGGRNRGGGLGAVHHSRKPGGTPGREHSGPWVTLARERHVCT